MRFFNKIFFLKLLHWFILTLLGVAILGGGVYGYRILSHKSPKVHRRKLTKSVPLVQVMTLHSQDIVVTVQGFGRTRAVRTLTLSPEVSGRVVKVHPRLKAGDFIEKNEIIVEIDPSNYQLAVEKAKSQIVSAKAKLARLEQEKRNLKHQISIVEENLQLVGSIFKRTLKLFEDGAVSETDRDRDQRSYLELKSRLVELESRYNLIPAQLKQAKAELSLCKIQLKQAELDLKRTYLRCPFPARVKSVKVEIGFFANINTPLVVLEDRTAVEIPTIIPERKLITLFQNPGEIAYLHSRKRLKAVVTYRHEEQSYQWTGQVVRFEPILRKERTVPVVVLVKNPWIVGNPGERPPLETGKFVSVTIYGKVLKNVLVVPRVALHEKNILYVVSKGHLELKKVHVCYRKGESFIVDKGVSPGDKIILSFLPFPVPGMALRIAKVSQTP